LSQAERQRILVDWNETGKPLRDDRCVHELFEAQVAAAPDAAAVIFKEQRITYRELNERANQLAHRLRATGTQANTLVAICLERSLEMVVGVLAVLKAGGAYVPIDPDYPAERLAFMLQDTAASTLLTDSRVDHAFVDGKTNVIHLDKLSESIASEPVHNLVCEAGPESLIYCIFTSGSTGRPKGALNTHRGFVNLVEWYFSERLQTRPAERVVLASSFSFDLTQKNILGTLAKGGTLIIPLGDAVDVDCTAAAAVEHQATRMNCAPSAFKMIQGDRSSRLAGTLVLGGEPIDAPLARQLSAQGVTLINSYGPTECSDVAISFLRVAESKSVDTPLGKPIANVKIYLLDAGLNPVPIGVAGEIHIAGVGLGRGYLNRPELTAEKFIPDPYGEAGSRMYKTGDLGRYLPDGNIEFLGRMDHQVKIRGFRIELGEIESALLGCEGVSNAVVVVREDEPGEKRLVGYVVAEERPGPTVGALREALQSRLPGYMVPTGWVFLEALPLTPNGKVDRQGLPAPEGGRAESGVDYVAPYSETQRLLAEIWSALLKVDRIGVHDNFFTLGGHSLLATRAVAKIGERFGVRIAVREFFENASLARLAFKVEAARHLTVEETQENLRIKIERTPESNWYPVTDLQARIWTFQQLSPESTAYHVTVAIPLPDGTSHTDITRAVRLLVERHEALRTVFGVADGQPVQIVRPAIDITLSHESVSSEDNLHDLIQASNKRSFDLEHGPLLRATDVLTWDGRRLVICNAHHIICDGVSLSILRKELLHTLGSASNAESLPLPSVRFTDFAVFQRKYLASAAALASKRFWMQRLKDANALALPYDFPISTHNHSAGASAEIVIAADTLQSLMHLAARKECTLFVVLLSGLVALLSRITGEKEVTVGVPVAGRDYAECQSVIGCFVNAVMIRTALRPDQSFENLMDTVRRGTIDAVAHQAYPFEQLVDDLKVPRDSNHFPISRVFLNLLNFEEAVDESGVLELSMEQDAKFDLGFYAKQQADGLRVLCHYRTACFSERTIAYVLEQLALMLTEAARGPCVRIGDIGVLALPRGASVSVAHDQSAKAGIFPWSASEQTIASRFRMIAVECADLPAIQTGSETITYRQLDSMARALAKQLSRRSKVNQRIALLLEDRVQATVAILAVTLAGCAFVPLDLTWPKQRLIDTLRELNANALITNRLGRTLADEISPGDVWVVEIDAVQDDSPQTGTFAQQAPSDPAYLLYTSGSTGKPKGVVQSHRNIMAHIRNYSSRLGISSADRLTWFPPYGFDAALMDIFGALLNGAVIIPMDPRSSTPREIGDRCRILAPTIFHLTPTLMRLLLTGFDGRTLDMVRFTVLGGEKVTPVDVDLFKKHFSLNCTLVNGYGPTECTVAAQQFIAHDASVSGALVPVGLPVPGVGICLDDPDASSHVFQRGEIIIKSEFVALSYFENREATDRAFGLDRNGRRFYRTGDVGRFLPDGKLEVLGRNDRQVKIRGFRIELEEVELAIRACEGIRAAVVEERADDEGQSRLVAYVVLSTGHATGASEIRRRLQDLLPSYMLPGAYVFLDRLPVNANGKTDRLALPSPPDWDQTLEADYVAPRTKTEGIVAQILSDVLKVERVGAYSNFFDLGGNSLQATQMVSRIAAAGPWRPRLRDVFANPTVEAFATYLERTDFGPSQTSSDNIRRRTRPNS
jgi:amino acid adenylation domain-containing protein